VSVWALEIQGGNTFESFEREFFDWNWPCPLVVSILWNVESEQIVRGFLKLSRCKEWRTDPSNMSVLYWISKFVTDNEELVFDFGEDAVIPALSVYEKVVAFKTFVARISWWGNSNFLLFSPFWWSEKGFEIVAQFEGLWLWENLFFLADMRNEGKNFEKSLCFHLLKNIGVPERKNLEQNRVFKTSFWKKEKLWII